MLKVQTLLLGGENKSGTSNSRPLKRKIGRIELINLKILVMTMMMMRIVIYCLEIMIWIKKTIEIQNWVIQKMKLVSRRSLKGRRIR